MSISKKQIVYADNCQACGQEHLNIELIPLKLGNKALPRVKICLGCLARAHNTDYEIENTYLEVADIILQTSKK